ncbi:MAG: hypothetical protein ACHP7N_16560 [Caulobacterales bacterium]
MFQGWDNFFFMIGSAAAGLIGLLFVVVTLTSSIERSQALRGATLYLTPTAMHFAFVLTISAVAIAPGLPASASAIVLGVVALVGLANALRSTIGILKPRQGMEPPHWTDAWMYGATPAAIYLGLSAASLGLWAHTPWAAHLLAAGLLGLLLVGIRNAWDLVTWIAPKRDAS